MNDMLQQLELLSRQINQAHRNAINSELAARGLSEIGHPRIWPSCCTSLPRPWQTL